MDAVKQVLRSRIRRFEALRVAGVTPPRFTAQLDSTIKIYGEMMKIEPPNLRETTQHLHALMNDLQDYWTKLFPDFESATRLYYRISVQRQFLRCKLLEDYLNDMPYVLDPELQWLARSQGDSTEREQAAKFFGIKPEGIENFYEQNLVSVLQEMLLDPDHVGRKLQAAAARNGQPGSGIQPLIDRCEWAALASTLVKDRILVDRLIPKTDFSDTRKEISDGIDRVQKKYFDTLISPDRFVISSRARSLSAKAVKWAENSPPIGAPLRYSDSVDDNEKTGQQDRIG